MTERNTILTAPPSPEQLELGEKEGRDFTRYKDLLELLYEGYVAGDIKTLDSLCLWLVEISKEFEGLEELNGKQVLPRIPQRASERWIGKIIMRAVMERPPEIKQNTVPQPLRLIICRLVKLAKEKDGYVLSRETKEDRLTAFQKI